MAIQLQEFAKQVLFGKTMEEKLSFPREEIVDTEPGAAIVTPRKLARPSHLTLREDGVKASHPSVAKLVDEKERGKLLHFFGNHELLATELMALVLLKFPDAPASFRRGVLETLKEEQIHTRLYIHRMKQCGVEFGELPLSDYFWRSVSSMEDPLDYVTRLSLTFEQANLDYSREYAKIFEGVGDTATAAILDKIYQDEIDHVGFGLKWFRRWKAEGKTDWEAFKERLVFPLSPARAKGDAFNAEGRSRVGFDESFINDLEVFRRSRGRTPSVLWFNPDVEFWVGKGMYKAGAGGKSSVQSDLSFLLAYLSKRDDLLVVDEAPSSEFVRTLQGYGFNLPETLLSQTVSGCKIAPEIDRKVGDLRPWAWGPDSVGFFKELFASVTRPLTPDTLWNDELKNLYSKVWGANKAKELARNTKDDWIAPESVYGRPAKDWDAFIEMRSELRDLGYRNIVCKAQYGTAANGNRCIMEGDEDLRSLRTWLDQVWNEQGCVLVEPWLERVFDFSVQFERKSADLKIVGYSRLVNNARGQFRGVITNGFNRGHDEGLTRFLMSRTSKRPRVFHWYEEVAKPWLSQMLDEAGFRGPLGVDAFVYKSPTGELLLKPVVEINPRYTMGRVGLELGEHNFANSVGFFQILNRSQLRKCGSKNFERYAMSLAEDHPVILSEGAKPRILSGSFALTDPGRAKQFLALYHVRKSFGDLVL